MSKTAICPGSFDPVTEGHLDIIKRSSKLFDKVIVVVMSNYRKANTATFTVEERMELIRRCTKDLPNVEIEHSDELLADYAKRKQCGVVVKGLRAVSDFEHEFQMALINHQLNPELDTMFLTSEHQFMFLSSSIVKELGNYELKHGELERFLPPEIIPDFLARMAEQQ